MTKLGKISNIQYPISNDQNSNQTKSKIKMQNDKKFNSNLKMQISK